MVAFVLGLFPRWACMSGAPASTGLVWGHHQFVSPPSCSASFEFRVNLTPERDVSHNKDGARTLT